MKKPVHVLLVSYEFPPEMAIGGIGSYMNHLALLLYNHHFKVTVFSATLIGEKVSLIQREHCDNYLIPDKNLPIFREKALKLFKELNGQLIFDVMESPEVGAYALDIKKEFPKMPLVVKLHTPGVLITKINRTYQPVLTKLRYVVGALKEGKLDLGYWSSKAKQKEDDPEYQICAIADALISPSNALKDWAHKFWSLSKKRIVVIPNPFTWRDSLIQLPLAPRKKQICFVGKLSILKGMFSFTQAIKLILNKYPEYCVVLVGRDEVENKVSMKDWMEEQLRPYRDKIIFAGVLNGLELEKVYTESAVGVFPSLWENYPTVVLESMAAGVAVAASKRGGIPEMITDKVDGLLFNPMNPNTIFKSVDYLLQNEERRIKIAANGREKVIALQKDLLQSETITNLFRSLANAG